MNRRFALVKFLLPLFTAACGIHAQDFYWSAASARSAALGGVYLPSPEGAVDALSANPAGLTFLKGRTVEMNVTGIFATGSFTNSVNAGAHLKDSPGVVPYGLSACRSAIRLSVSASALRPN